MPRKSKSDKPVEKTAVKADKKVKKAAPKDKVLTLAEMRTKSPDELIALIKSSQADLEEFQRMNHASELPASHVIAKTRRQIARLNTVLTQIQRASEQDNPEEDK
ncbi:MAG: 50S ribosomal protein L29 [Candidatus Nomurabacteria bacterium]|jgi:ribosomal protein L29|nr:50S ribosomal protein L29 [Candidatus Nomurabacteria bacterium]